RVGGIRKRVERPCVGGATRATRLGQRDTVLDRVILDRVILDRVILDRVILDRVILDRVILDRVILDRVILDRAISDIRFVWFRAPYLANVGARSLTVGGTCPSQRSRSRDAAVDRRLR